MAAKITSDVLESYLHCKLKGHLKLTGQQGIRCDFDTMLAEMRADVRLAAIDKILARHAGEEIPSNIPLTTTALKRGASFILDGTLEDDLFLIHFDGLKKVEGPSKLGHFHYIPMLFSERPTVRKEEKLSLALYGLLLSRLQGAIPVQGIVWHGKECKVTKVRLNTDLRNTERLRRDLRDICNSESSPKLILNEHCKVCEFRQTCHAQALKEDNLSLLRSLGLKEISNYARKGILTVTQLAHTFRPRRRPKRAAKSSTQRYHALQALAIRDKRIYVFGTPEAKPSPVSIYLDVESTYEQGAVYLIGMIVVEDGSETLHSLWSDDDNQEQDIFEQFLAIVSKYAEFSIFCYGGYEKAFLKRMGKGVTDRNLVNKVLSRLVNALALIYSHIYFPTYSNGLKDIGRFLGCCWTDADASGIQSMVWRNRWQSTRGEESKQALLTYNMEDCWALRKVTDLLHAIDLNAGPENGSVVLGDATVPVSSVQDVDKLSHDRKWGKVKFYHPEYEFINNCAYFDYQRDRVFVRTSQTLRRRKAKQAGRINRKLRVTKRLKITSSACPHCNSDQLTTVVEGERIQCQKPRVKRAFDLSFTSGGIRRKVIECRTSMYQCLDCGRGFVPQEYQRLDKHFHGLKSWATFLHVAHRLSLVTIQSMIEDAFGLQVCDSEVHMFKTLMARYYDSTYRSLLSKILAGNLLHVDETQVTLHAGKGYVWVFTNLEEVVFMFRPTREGDFLKELLVDFKGVLVSDFYAAYDSLDCPQQKCLIHLIRDMNQELLNDPFDSELQLVTQPFGTLLRTLVGVVDQHGLKKTHLLRHKKEIEVYFQQLSAQSFRSEAAESLRGRLLKNRDKLFTFINHDGVPWNNNNAENAIKRFAYYREGTVGTMKESGLSDYLALLSVCHTCRYKGVSFLHFLLSREKDMDVFCSGKRTKRERPVIEVYPEGFVSPLVRRQEKAKSKNGKYPECKVPIENAVGHVAEKSLKESRMNPS